MKRIKCILVMAIMAICLVGCGKYENMFQINSDGTGSIAILYALNPSVMEAAGMNPDDYNCDSIFFELRDRGYTVEKYDKDGYEGYVVSAQNVDINSTMNDLYVEGSGMEMVGFGSGKFNMKKNGNDCSIDWYIYNTDAADTLATMRQTLEADGATARITLYLPSPAYDHDAPYVSDDGAALQWDLLDLGSDQALHASFKLDGSAAGTSGGQQSQQGQQGQQGQSQQGSGFVIDIYTILLILGMCAVGGTGLYLYLSSRKKEKIQEMYENYNGGMNPLAMGGMGMQQPQQNPTMAQMSGMGQKTTFGAPQGMGGMNNPNPMGMASGMGAASGMQNNQWGGSVQPQQAPGMNQMAGMNQPQPSGAQWAPQQPQPQPQMSNFQAQQMSNVQPQQVSNYGTDPSAAAPTNATPDWGMNN